MVTNNDDVSNGISNGTTCLFEKVFLKQNVKMLPIQVHGFWIYAVDIDDVDHLQFKWTGSSRFEGHFKLFAKTADFTVRFPVTELGRKFRVSQSVSVTHFPLFVNFATTGHKLQGKSLDALVIAEWNRTKNWAYVVLSRVRKFEGLFFLEDIPSDLNFDPSPDYLDMITRLRNSIVPKTDEVSKDISDLRTKVRKEYETKSC